MITQKRLKHLVDYDPLTGIFLWKSPKCNRVQAGDVAGCISNGYLIFSVDGVLHRAHRLAWLYVYGEWPKDQIDHINHNKTDNRIINLRDVDNAENHKNRSINPSNTSGVCGVYWDKERGKWTARIKANGKLHYLGRFDDFDGAVRSRKEADMKYGYHKNHGKLNK